MAHPRSISAQLIKAAFSASLEPTVPPATASPSRRYPWFFCRFVSNRGIPGVLMRLAICLVVAGLSILVTFGKTEVFRDSKKIAIRMLKR